MMCRPRVDSQRGAAAAGDLLPASVLANTAAAADAAVKADALANPAAAGTAVFETKSAWQCWEAKMMNM